MYIHSAIIMIYLMAAPLCIDESLRDYYLWRLRKKRRINTIDNSVYLQQVRFLQTASYLITLIPIILSVAICDMHYEWDGTNSYLNRSLFKLFLLGLAFGSILLVIEFMYWLSHFYKKIRYKINVRRENTLLFSWIQIITCFSMAIICLMQYVFKVNLYVVVR